MRIGETFRNSQAFTGDTLRSLSMILTAGFMVFMLFFPSFKASASDIHIRLFKENGRIVSDYNKQIQKIKELAEKNQLPITVEFSKGLSFTVYDAHSGAQNLVMDIGQGKVLRTRLFKYTPLRFWNAFINPASMVDSLGNYILGYKTLIQNHIPIPELTILPGHEKEFLIIEKINIAFSYADYLDQEFYNKLDPKELPKIENDFLEFAKKSARFRKIGEFGSSQFVYSKNRGWVLLDFSNTNEFANGLGGNIFEFDRYDKLTNMDTIQGHFLTEIIKKPGLPEHLKTKVHDIINKERNPTLNISCHQLFNP